MAACCVPPPLQQDAHLQHAHGVGQRHAHALQLLGSCRGRQVSSQLGQAGRQGRHLRLWRPGRAGAGQRRTQHRGQLLLHLRGPGVEVAPPLALACMQSWQGRVSMLATGGTRRRRTWLHGQAQPRCHTQARAATVPQAGLTAARGAAVGLAPLAQRPAAAAVAGQRVLQDAGVDVERQRTPHRLVQGQEEGLGRQARLVGGDCWCRRHCRRRSGRRICAVLQARHPLQRLVGFVQQLAGGLRSGLAPRVPVGGHGGLAQQAQPRHRLPRLQLAALHRRDQLAAGGARWAAFGRVRLAPGGQARGARSVPWLG